MLSRVSLLLAISCQLLLPTDAWFTTLSVGLRPARALGCWARESQTPQREKLGIRHMPFFAVKMDSVEPRVMEPTFIANLGVADSFPTALGNGVQPYIDLIDKIRELGIESDLEGGIPQIAVMGDQSSGKSSVHLFPSFRLSPSAGRGPYRCEV